MWNPIRHWKLKLSRDWRLVSTLQATYTKNDGTEKVADVFYYLYENGLGKRKCEHDGSRLCAGNSSYTKLKRVSHPYYLQKIKPWLAGAFDPEIPSYKTIKHKEMKDSLAGRKT